MVRILFPGNNFSISLILIMTGLIYLDSLMVHKRMSIKYENQCFERFVFSNHCLNEIEITGTGGNEVNEIY